MSNIPRRPPIWCCSCGCKRFRKVNPDGTDASVKVKMLKDIRKKSQGSVECMKEQIPSVDARDFDIMVKWSVIPTL